MPSQNSYLKLGLVVLLLVVTVVLSGIIFPHSGDSKSLIKPEILQSFNLVSTFKFGFRSEELSKIVQDRLKDKDGEYAVYIEDLTDGEKYTLRSSDSFLAASLYKVYLMAAVLKEIEDGRLKMEDGLSSSKDHLEEVFGDSDFGYEDAPDQIEYTVEEALERVGRISDNFASIMLAEKIGWDKVVAMADSLGVENTKIKAPISTSASDIGEFFKDLYQKKVVSESVSNRIIDLLSLSQLNDRIPAGVPDDIKVVHKTGELSGIRNDAGIVYLEGRAYVIVLMSKNLKYEDDGVETLVNISKGVYEYFKVKESSR